MPLSSDILKPMEKQEARPISAFARRVIERRDAMGLSTNALADKAGIDRGNFSKMLSGARAATRPPAETVQRWRQRVGALRRPTNVRPEEIGIVSVDSAVG